MLALIPARIDTVFMCNRLYTSRVVRIP
jgi:hypothetical protein